VRLTIPTLLTLFRILMIPVMVVLFYWKHPWSNVFTTAVFVAGALTDWLDGWVARRYGMYSDFGAFLDPVADKLMVAAALIVLTEKGFVDPFASLIIIGREITISALREWMAQIGQSKSVAVNILGKLKTVMQLVAIPFLLYDANLLGVYTRPVGQWLIAAAAALTLWSMVVYLKAAIAAPPETPK
jgi:CDP-diacylglycerol--glycerol-3-phosphate 3-phosphatidyltransferase